MTAVSSPYLTRHFIVGAICLAFVTFGYLPVVSAFYYGGGFPFVQIIYVIIYVIGVRRVRRSEVPRWLRWSTYLAPAVWWTIVTQWDLLMAN